MWAFYCFFLVALVVADYPHRVARNERRPPPCMYRKSNDSGTDREPCVYEDFDLVDPSTLRREIYMYVLMDHLAELQRQAYSYPARNRVVGGPAHNETIEYIAGELEALSEYYDVERHYFDGNVRISQHVVLRVDGKPMVAEGLGYPRPQVVKGRLVPITAWGCNPEDYPDSVEGNIALAAIDGLEWGTSQVNHKSTCSFNQIIAAALVKGATAVITAAIPEERASKTDIPVLQIWQRDAWALRLQLEEDPVGPWAEINVHDYPMKRVESYNIIATTRHGDPENTLMLGAHTDSVAAGPGINDNGSGTAALLELAIQLARFRTNSRVRFAFWTAEESGLKGSRHWIQRCTEEELDEIRVYLNFDMIASPNFKLGAYDGDNSDYYIHAPKGQARAGPRGSEHAEQLLNEFFWSQGWNTSSSPFDGRSDYGPFIAKGVPSGGTFTGAERNKTEAEWVMFGGTAGEPYDPNYHLEDDNMDNVNFTAFEMNVNAIAHALGTYARGFEGFPERGPRPERVKRFDDEDDSVELKTGTGSLCGGRVRTGVHDGVLYRG